MPGFSFNGFPKPVKDANGLPSIKSVQRGVYNLAAASSSIPISKVDKTKSIVYVKNYSGVQDPDITLTRAYINPNGNALTVERYSTSATPTDISWEVIEFNNVKSKQEGDVSLLSNAEVVVNVSAVDISKSVFVANHMHSQSGGTNAGHAYAMTCRVVNNTQLAFKISLAQADIHWELIEFY